jgi:putative acetyltransferase
MPVRDYEPQDCEAVLEVWEAAARQSTPFFTEDFIRGEREAIRARWLPESETWVYQDGEAVVGFIALVGDEVGGFFVDPAWQGRGFGRALMDHVQALRRSLVLEVFTENSIGRAFYEAYGFEVVGQSVHEPTGRTQLRMRFES